MSGTDEELQFIHNQEMDHVTYILIMFRFVARLFFFLSAFSSLFLIKSMAFLLYFLIVSLIHLYATAGKNGASLRLGEDGASGDVIEMSSGGSGQNRKWYSRVPNVETQHHVIGDDED